MTLYKGCDEVGSNPPVGLLCRDIEVNHEIDVFASKIDVILP